jgi:hypothetical protein
LIRALCHHEPQARICETETRSDQWFATFDWTALRTCRMSPPLAPKVRHARDLSNFRSCDQEEPPRVPYKDKGTGWDLGFEDSMPTQPTVADVPAPSASIVSKATNTPPTEASSRGGTPTSAQQFSISAESTAQSPRQVPAWAWTSAKCPAQPVTGPPMLQVTGAQSKSGHKAQQSSKAGPLAGGA